MNKCTICISREECDESRSNYCTTGNYDLFVEDKFFVKESQEAPIFGETKPEIASKSDTCLDCTYESQTAGCSLNYMECIRKGRAHYKRKEIVLTEDVSSLIDDVLRH
jgi:hypothetical protein